MFGLGFWIKTWDQDKNGGSGIFGFGILRQEFLDFDKN